MAQSQEIVCALCRKASSDFDAINQKINQAKTPTEKAPHARELIEKVEAVANEHRQSQGTLALACMELLNLRKQTAQMIIRLQER